MTRPRAARTSPRPRTARTARPPSPAGSKIAPALPAKLERLHRTIRGCSKCFKRGGNCPVPGTGLPRPGGFFLIGQAPGVREPAAQKNFAWTAGKRLFQWFNTIGMTEGLIRENGYLTAVTKCYPGKDKAGRGDRKPAPWEIDNCAPYLDEALRLLSPRVVVLIGAMAMDRILGVKEMSGAIGVEFEKDLPGGPAFVIPLPHPSGASPWPYLPGNKEKLARALSLVKRRLKAEGLYPLFTPKGA